MPNLYAAAAEPASRRRYNGTADNATTPPRAFVEQLARAIGMPLF
jgi:hypothetical protein